MYICNYCKRNFKEKYEICPACGGKSFSEKAYLGEVVIKKPPKDGYKINMAEFNRKLKNAKRIKLIGLIIALVLCIFDWPFILIFYASLISSIQEKTFNFDVFFMFSILSAIIPIVVIIISFYISIKQKKKILLDIKKVNILSKTGILVKNLPYKLESDGSMINGHPITMLLEVSYQNANGVKIPLTKRIKYNLSNNKDTVDLLIDPNDYSNYYIDYEIY